WWQKCSAKVGKGGLIGRGDKGIMGGLDAIAHARKGADNRDWRHRLEHAYLWNVEAMDRMGELGVIWNTQPPLLEIIGREGVYSQWGDRARFAFPFRSLTERGVIISGGF